MSPKTKIIFVFSFCLNAVLAAAWYANRSAPITVVKSDFPAQQKSRPLKTTFTNEAGKVITVTREKDLDWSSVESPDYREYIKNLRAIGCPEQTVRDIIIADINKLYAGKLAALYPSAKDIKFWRVQDRNARNEDRDRDKKRGELEKEKRALIKELLGIDYDAEMAELSGRPSDDDMRYGFLSPEKQQAAKDLREKYREMERSLFGDGRMTPENREKFMAMRAQRDSEMATLLGPADFEQYQLHNSFTARNMRDNLTGFQPTEDEFKKIFDARRSFDEQYGFSRDQNDPDRKAASDQLNEQLKSVLGEQRYQDYQASQDERYRDIFDFTQRYNLPRETADTVYQVRVAAEQERQRIQNDPNLTGDARTAALQAMAQTTKDALTQTLGNDGMQNYSSRGGTWVDRMGQTDGNTDSRDRRNRFDRGDRGRRSGRN